MTTLDFALHYISRGWAVIPIAFGTKAPPAGFPLARYLSGEWRSDEASCRVWWAEGDYGIAVLTGKISGILVADVDPRNGGDTTAIRARITTPCPTVLTGGGGLHFYFRLEQGQSIRSGHSSVQGVDRCADLRYVVAPPSIHPNGTPYRWEN